MLKTTKRVIKLPHGSGNSNDVPKEVPGIPSTTISFRTGNFENHDWEQGSDRAAPIFGTGGVCQSLCTIEFPCYGPKTLHYVLEYFHGFYDSNYIIKKSLELENYQCAAKLATLDRRYHAAVTYQLKALALATFCPEIAVAEPTSVEENVSNKSASDDSMNSDLKVKDNDTSSELSRDERSITSTPDSEMHTFSVQGGHEQMSDSNQGHSSVTRLGSAPTSDSSVKLADLMAQASLIVEFYVSMMEEDSHTMMSSLLQQGIEFWLEHSLPMDHLENVLRKHMAKFFYPLGLLLFW
ncbi:unnamed protein product [Timema podura]|uniref:Uncharacterized protein n=1 Tax=Timema podura TaxID=61482 RepID=A0ABN7NM83_TIMPD|nr:unnamed protein product [Timema podura]